MKFKIAYYSKPSLSKFPEIFLGGAFELKNDLFCP